ncbi:ferrous iron transporter B [Metapseudomonas boanensis]|uniref:Ferrous iron transporter B n=1 Tax=Metapseudomonas boanensis TaxID=2822138 RepID=A0ABS5XG14_9GAMM|nr:ferrous iron transporter B [Pseudomonas boanensis]MBT8766632.1 ferrous iron transporter B [Pseudomonas boanensis]
MVTGVTSLGLVRDELFATMEQAEQSLEHFIAERQNGSLLQQAVEALHQVRGTLDLIELTGAKLLAQELLDQATDIPTGAGEERDDQLSALSSALYVLRRYLENLDLHRQEMPELLLPAINELRKTGSQAPLPESYFFSVRLDLPREAEGAVSLKEGIDRDGLARRLRHVFQQGLLGFLRNETSVSALRLMERALGGLERIFANDSRGRLCWIGAAAIESLIEGQLLPLKPRKQLFSRLDRELKVMLGNAHYEAPRNLQKELLYLVALADANGRRASEVRQVFGMPALPFTDQLLDQEYQRLSGPGQSVMRSLSTAISEELAGVKDLIDLIERGTAAAESYGSLQGQLSKLAKTLVMVGLNSPGNALLAQVPMVALWSADEPIDPAALLKLADAVLYVESTVANLEQGDRRPSRQQLAEPGREVDSFASHQLAEARIVVLDEAQVGLALAKRAITSYLESNGERLHLANVPLSLQAVRGGLWFLGQERAAALVGACADYIQGQMLETSQMPSEPMLEALADALTSLEYYMEGGASMHRGFQSDVLDLAANSVQTLGLKVAA